MSNLSQIGEAVVRSWVRRGLHEFYLGYYISPSYKGQTWTYHNFLYHQGLEKIGKAYILGAKENHYKSLSEKDAKEKVDEIAKALRHGLKYLINELISYGALKEQELSSPITYERNRKSAKKGRDGIENGWKMIELLEKSYIECRYPVPEPVHTKYKTSFFPLSSSGLDDFALKLGRIILLRIRERFEMIFTRRDVSSINDDYAYGEFCKLFGISQTLSSLDRRD